MTGPFDANPYVEGFLGGPTELPAECDECGRKVDMTVRGELGCPDPKCGGKLRDSTTEGRAA